MRNIWIVIVTAGCVSFAACSSGLGEEDTRIAWAATNVALTQGQAQAQAAASGMPLAPSPETDEIRPRVAAQVDFTWSCTEGGKAHYSGSAEVVSDAGGSDVSFDLATDFDACGVSGVAISGSLDYSAAVGTSSGSTTTTMTMKGDLSFAGKVEGDCELDMTSKVAVTSGGDGSSVSVSYDGSICGNSASATLDVQG